MKFLKYVALMFFSLLSLRGFSQCEIGAFVGESPPYKETINNFENLIGKDVSSVMWFQNWTQFYPLSFPNSDFLRKNIQYHDGYNTHTILHITLEPWVDLKEIAKGAYDNVLRNYAQKCKEWGDEIRIRFGHEMIHDDNPSTYGWYPWQDKPVEYKEAFKRIYNVFQEVGANNVKFVWSPNNYLDNNTPPTLEVLEKYFPGINYVDWLGIDGYNWGSAQDTFDKLFHIVYFILTTHTEIFGNKPIMLGEFACAEGDFKPKWIEEALKKLKEEYTKIKAFYWFNITKEKDWRIESSPESLEAFKKAINDSYFISHPSSSGGDGDDNKPPSPQPPPSNPQAFRITLRIPRVHMLKVAITKINNSSWEETSEINFGKLTYDETYRIFRAGYYFAVDVGVISNDENWVITHTVTPITNGIDTLDNNINVVFVKCSPSKEVEINKCSFRNSNSFSLNKLQLQGGWLRIYYGIATGSGEDATGVTPITMDKTGGTYSGTITITLTP